MSQETIYVPKSSAKARTNDFGEIINISFLASELGAFVNKHKDEKGYIRLTIVPRKEVGQYGDTHSIKLDTWKPNASKAAGAPAAKPKAKAAAKPDPLDQPASGDDDIPF